MEQQSYLAIVADDLAFFEPENEISELPLWEPDEVEWFVIIRMEPKSHRRRKKGRIVVIQPPLWTTNMQASV